MSRSTKADRPPADTSPRSIEELREEALRELEATDPGDPQGLEAWRVRYLGRRGRLTQVLRSLADLPLDERRTVGAAANRLKGLLEERLAASREQDRARVASGVLDVTLPGTRRLPGRLHPVTQTIRDVTEAFVALGFQIVEGPEIESDHYNFTLLNIPPGHPARDMFDTFYIEGGRDDDGRSMVLRCHTSPMQARIMERTEPPVRVVVPGRCFRYEATDATHEWHFHQIEVLAVDEGITFADLKGTLYEFARRTFGPDRRVRFRCDFFPFVEPGVEMAIDCLKCRGSGCSMCRQSGWIEVLGAGMVHPNVLAGVGYDTERYTGFAAGMGVERVAMLRHGINDIRLFAANDLRFLSQF